MEILQIFNFDNTLFYYRNFGKFIGENFSWGIGGIFFDLLTSNDDHKLEAIFEFVKDIGYLFPKIYGHFMRKNDSLPYGDQEKAWQSLRRGRYVEFNLVWDAGTKFGLDTNGRTESILMSMPPIASWEYMHQPKINSTEAFTLNYLKKDIDWINIIKP